MDFLATALRLSQAMLCQEWPHAVSASLMHSSGGLQI
jgi:hypothetical protein